MLSYDIIGASITDPINSIFNAQSDQPEYQGQYHYPVAARAFLGRPRLGFV